MFLRRAGVIAAQQLPTVKRHTVFDHSVSHDPELSQLWSYLEQHLKYDWFVWNKRKYRLADEPVSQLESYEAIGTVGGTLSKFRAYSQFENYDD